MLLSLMHESDIHCVRCESLIVLFLICHYTFSHFSAVQEQQNKMFPSNPVCIALLFSAQI